MQVAVDVSGPFGDVFSTGSQLELTTQQNLFKIQLKSLEDELLSRLSAAQGNFLGDLALVEQLEGTKATAAHIHCKVRPATAGA